MQPYFNYLNFVLSVETVYLLLIHRFVSRICIFVEFISESEVEMHQNNDESLYEDANNETNMLSNTLLAEKIKEKIDNNKKKFISNMKTQLIQISSHLQDYCNSYKKLR